MSNLLSINNVSTNWLLNGRSSNPISLQISYRAQNVIPGGYGIGPGGEQYALQITTHLEDFERTDIVWSYVSTVQGTLNINNWNINLTAGFTNNQVLELYAETYYADTQVYSITVKSVELNYNGYATNNFIKFNETTTLPSSSTPVGYSTPTQWFTNGITFSVGATFNPAIIQGYLISTWIVNFVPVLNKITYSIGLNANGGTGGSISPSTYQIEATSQTKAITLPTRSGWSFTNWTLSNIAGNAQLRDGWSYAGSGQSEDDDENYFASVAFGSSCSSAIENLQYDGTVANWLNQNYPSGNYANNTSYISVNIKTYNGVQCHFTRYSDTGNVYATNNNTTLNIRENTYGNFTTVANWTFANEGVSYNITKSQATGTTITVDSTYDASDANQLKSATISASTGYNLTGVSLSRLSPFGGNTPTIALSSGSTYTILIPAYSFGPFRVNSTSSLINYTISYVVNSGTGAHNNPTSYNVESNVSLVQGSMVRTGYTFGGWYNNAEFTGSAITSFTGQTGNKTFYAKWTLISYDISYTLNGSTAYPITNSGHGNPTIYDIEDATITFAQSNLARAGWTFNVWNPTSITTGSTGNKSTSASWNTIEYTIALSNNSGTGIAIDDNTYDTSENNGSAITRTLTEPTRAGWTFNSYAITRTGTNGGTAPSISTNTLNIPSGSYGPMTVTAQWDGNTGNTITFAGADIASQTWTTSNASQDKTFTIPAKTGYRINTVTITTQSQGVNSSVSYEDYDGTITIPANAYGSIIVTIAYIANTYTVTFDSQNGSAADDIAATYDVNIGALTNPTLAGYNFNGWFTASAGGTQVTSTSNNLTSVHEGTVTLYAQWSPKTLTIVYNNGTGTGTMTNSTGLYNGYVLVKANTFTKTGYSFAGWVNSDTEADITAPLQNTNYSAVELSSTIGTTTETGVSITLTAQWTINEYTVTFNSNGGSLVASITQDYNTSIAEPTDPTLAGYTFSGWYSDVALTNAVTFPFNLPANSLTLYAKWLGITYDITFIENGGSAITDLSYVVGVNSQTKTLTPGTKTVAHKKHTFNSWEITVQSLGSDSSISGNTLTIPANAYGDITIQARWNVAERFVYIGSKRLEEDKIRVDAAGSIITRVVITDGDINETVIYDKTLELEEVE